MPGWKLGALLKELRENRLHDKSDQVAGGASDLLWDDLTLVSYINEAQRRFAREALVIHDYTSSITTLTTVAGQQYYPLDPSIVYVNSVKMDDSQSANPYYDHTSLPRAGYDAFFNYHTPDPLFFDANQLEQLTPGKALAWSTDEGVIADANGSFGVMQLRLFPVIASPYDGILYRIRVVREPINDLTSTNLNAYPEIPAAHHLDILDHAAYLALSNVDTDVAGANAVERAQGFEASFQANIAKAKRLSLRKMFAPLQWGFGHNGWSWIK